MLEQMWQSLEGLQNRRLYGSCASCCWCGGGIVWGFVVWTTFYIWWNCEPENPKRESLSICLSPRAQEHLGSSAGQGWITPASPLLSGSKQSFWRFGVVWSEVSLTVLPRRLGLIPSQHCERFIDGYHKLLTAVATKASLSFCLDFSTSRRSWSMTWGPGRECRKNKMNEVVQEQAIKNIEAF